MPVSAFLHLLHALWLWRIIAHVVFNMAALPWSMELQEKLVARAVSCLARRYVEISFSIPEAVQSLSDSKFESERSAVDSDNELWIQLLASFGLLKIMLRAI